MGSHQQKEHKATELDRPIAHTKPELILDMHLLTRQQRARDDTVYEEKG